MYPITACLQVRLLGSDGVLCLRRGVSLPASGLSVRVTAVSMGQSLPEKRRRQLVVFILACFHIQVLRVVDLLGDLL